MSRVSRVFCSAAVVLAVLEGVVIGLLWWASIQPKRAPRNLKGTPAWIVDPMPRFAYFPFWLFVPRGFWVSCWLDTQRNVDMCEFADFNGKVSYEGDYTTCDGRPPLPTNEVGPTDFHQAVSPVLLVRGGSLIPVDECRPQSRDSGPPKTQSPPG